MILRIAAIVLALVILAFAFTTLLDWRAGKAFGRVKLGDKEQLTLGYLGGPSGTGPCPDTLWWEDENLGSNNGRCVRWTTYRYFRSTWAVGYSADGHVVAKHHYVGNTP